MQLNTASHDLRLPSWGPYTKKYIGISHITDPDQGIRFDLSLIPGLYRRKVDIPNVTWESGYHPWEAAPDLSFFTHRHELEWKDQVYADISYSKLSDQARLIRCHYVNRTQERQNVVLHFMASLHAPQDRSHGNRLQEAEAALPADAVWTDALDYETLQWAFPRPSDQLVYDGMFRGEERIQHFVKGSGLGAGFGKDKGDQATYKLSITKKLTDPVLLVRYRAQTGASTLLRIDGDLQGSLNLRGTGEIELASSRLPSLEPGDYTVTLISEGGSPVQLDGFVITEQHLAAEAAFKDKVWSPVPQILDGPKPNTLLLRYEGTELYYGLLWSAEHYEVRELYTSELDRFMRHYVHDHVNAVLRGDGNGHFTNVFLRPIPLAPESEAQLYGMICSGSYDEVCGMLASFDEQPEACTEHYEKARRQAVVIQGNPEGQTYEFSQRLLASTTLLNVVFPVYTQRSYIRHYTPGRWWDSLYTWDSGFIGIGLAEMDTERAIDCLNAYLTEPGNPHAAFIHHGSMVPVQHYLFLELWNKLNSMELLRNMYPMLRQYYLFYIGDLGSSTTRIAGSGLIRTWDYFYNSGGWDDYPPQKHVHSAGISKTTAPVVNSCHGIRIAKMLRMAAEALELQEDIAEYTRTIEELTYAVEAHAWDEEAGYYGYVRHEDGVPAGILRYEDGTNYNMGLDGVYPLLAGICSEERKHRLLSYFTDDKKLWCSVGLSTVDQSAPYYKPDGYWNGAVWMPHQWFFWKTMLDLGQGDIAYRIAITALEVYKRETDNSYNCFEHFIVESGRGAGWHHFGGLSTPVLSWYSAYFRPGTVSCGFDVWIQGKRWSPDFSEAELELKHTGHAAADAFTVLLVMNPAYTYQCLWDEQELQFVERCSGCMEVAVPSSKETGTLKVVRVQE